MKIEDEIKQQAFKSEFQKAGVNLIYTYFWMKERISQNLKEHDITMQQYNVLRILNGQYPKAVTTSTIRERMMDKMSDASRLVERLKVQGLVDKCVNSHDRRLVSVVISEKGRSIINTIIAKQDVVENTLGGLSEAEARTLNTLLNKMRG
jgi:DNA-binding MarR family transcriptional regulator